MDDAAGGGGQEEVLGPACGERGEHGHNVVGEHEYAAPALGLGDAEYDAMGALLPGPAHVDDSGVDVEVADLQGG